jgi:hypothetical protein
MAPPYNSTSRLLRWKRDLAMVSCKTFSNGNYNIFSNGKPQYI